jgi:hypothetical protein
LLFPIEGDSTPVTKKKKKKSDSRREPNTREREDKARRTTADFKQVVVSDTHDLLASVDDDGTLFDDTVGADDDGASKSKDGRLGMDDRAWSDGDVALEIDVLADDRLRVDRKLVASEMTKVSRATEANFELCLLTWVVA